MQLHVRSGPFPWIRSEILAALANPFAADLRRDPCYWQRRSIYLCEGCFEETGDMGRAGETVGGACHVQLAT